jgi:predicted HicB family RNase H-like nuclease
MKTMTYKGYKAHIIFDDRDEIYVGRILGVADLISFHASSVSALAEELKLAVEDFLAHLSETRP